MTAANRSRWLTSLRTFRGHTEDEARLAAWAADEIERLEGALKHIADTYDAETSAAVPDDPEAVGTPGPHHWVELSQWIKKVLSEGGAP